MTPEIFSGAAVLAALFYLRHLPEEQSVLRSVFKTLPVDFLVVGAVILQAWGLAVALGFSAIGDWVLSREGKRNFLIGLCSFALAHAVYVPVMRGPLAGWEAIPFAILVMGVLALSTEVWLRPFVGNLVWPVRGYVLVIFLMAASGLGHGVSLVALGAALFVLSDFCLALREFRASGRAGNALGWVVWLTYVPGQVLIFYGLVG